MVIIYLFPRLGFVVAAKNSCCSSRSPKSLVSGQSLQLSNSNASVSRSISFCFLASLLKKALLPGPPAPAEFIIVTPFIIAIPRLVRDTLAGFVKWLHLYKILIRQRPHKNNCCSTWNPESLASGQSLQLSNSKASVCFRDPPPGGSLLLPPHVLLRSARLLRDTLAGFVTWLRLYTILIRQRPHKNSCSTVPGFRAKLAALEQQSLCLEAH